MLMLCARVRNDELLARLMCGFDYRRGTSVRESRGNRSGEHRIGLSLCVQFTVPKDKAQIFVFKSLCSYWVQMQERKRVVASHGKQWGKIKQLEVLILFASHLV